MSSTYGKNGEKKGGGGKGDSTSLHSGTKVRTKHRIKNNDFFTKYFCIRSIGKQ